MMSEIKKYFFFLLFFLGSLSHAQIIKFAKVFGGNNFESPRSVKQTYDKGYIVAGSTSSFNASASDFYLAKLDSFGVVKWHKLIGTSNIETGYYIDQTTDSGFVVAGYMDNTFGSGYDAHIIKTDKNGEPQWQKNFGGNDWDFAYHIRQTSDLGYIVAGGTFSYGAGNEDAWVIKLDGNGDTMWTKTFGGTADDEFRAVRETGNGDYILTGFSTNINTGKKKSFVVRIDANGTLIWSKIYGGNDMYVAYDIIESLNGRLFLTGQSQATGNSSKKLFIMKLEANGDSIWTNYFGTSGDNAGYSICQTKSGKIAVGGYLTSGGGVGGGGKDFFLQKVDSANGNYIWGPTYGNLGNEICYGIENTTDNGFVLVGETIGSYTNQQSDVWVVKTDSMGGTVGSVTVANTLNVQENNSAFKKFSIIPNGTNEISLLIPSSITNEEIKNIIVYDLLGQKVLEEKPLNTNSGNIILNFENKKASEIYILSIITSSSIYSEKFFGKTQQ